MVTWESNGHVTDYYVSVKGQGRYPNLLMAQYIENGWRYRFGSNRPAIGNGPLRFDWSRD